MIARAQQPYANASIGGFLLGLVMLVSFVATGRGLGASGAFADVAAKGVDAVAPELIRQSPAIADRLSPAQSLVDSWIFWEVVGLFIGGALSSWWYGRRARAEQVAPLRVARSAAGGVLMGIGARLAYGCTSGLALSGGATLATGAWIFIPVAFATAILVTLSVRSSAQAS